MLSLIKTIGGPGSLGFLLANLGAGLLMAFIWPRRRRIVRLWVAGLGGTYLLLSLPWVAGALEARLPESPSAIQDPPGDRRLLIVLDGDNRHGRAVTMARLWRANRSATVWVLGGPEIVQKITALDVPRDQLNISSMEKTTRSQIERVKTVASSSDGRRETMLIASRVQMPRIARLVRTAGLDLTLIASDPDYDPQVSGLQLWLPSLGALTLSRDVIYEHAALAYYRWRGWI